MINLNMAKIQLNGKKITIKQKFSLFNLLQKYKLDKKKNCNRTKRLNCYKKYV